MKQSCRNRWLQASSWIEVSVAVKRMYVKIIIVINPRLKFTLMLLTPRGWRVRSLDWCLRQPGFDPGYGKLICLATLMSSDRTKQICLWMTIEVSIYIYVYSIETPKWRCVHRMETQNIRHCSRSTTRGHASPIPLNHLSRLRG